MALDDDVVFDIATPNEDGTDLEFIGQIRGKQNLVDFLMAIRPTDRCVVCGCCEHDHGGWDHEFTPGP